MGRRPMFEFFEFNFQFFRFFNDKNSIGRFSVLSTIYLYVSTYLIFRVSSIESTKKWDGGSIKHWIRYDMI